MSLLDALWLGILQALTEFLPVSSSGHLRLAHALLGAQAPDDLLFDLMLHVGTLAAVVVVYRRDLAKLIYETATGLRALPGGIRTAFETHEGLRLTLLLGLATLPTGVIGVLLKDLLEGDALGVRAVCALLILNGGVLWLSRRPAKSHRADGPFSVAGIGPWQALAIGVAQGIAVLPGISRSGMTIVTALLLGADRMRAAQFSFLLSIPAILGAVMLKVGDTSFALDGNGAAYALGTATSAVGGALALWQLLRMLRAAQFHHFAWYCWALGAGGLWLTWTG